MRSTAQFVYITEVDLSIDNGQGINEREFVTALVQSHGSDVACIAPYPARPATHLDPRIEYVTPFRRSPVLYPLHLASVFSKVLRLHRRTQLCGLVFRLGYTPILPLLLAQVLGKPFILKTLGTYTLYGDASPAMKRRLVYGALRPLYRAAVRSASLADTPSGSYATWLSRTYGVPRDRLHVVPNAANTRFFCASDQSGVRHELALDRFSKIVGYVGDLGRLRNIDALIRALQLLGAAPHIGLVLVGEGPDRGVLQRLADELGVARQVLFVGQVPYPLVPKYIGAFDLAVDLSLVPMRVGERTLYGSYSQKIPQYLACGVPVLAWDVPDNHFLAEHGLGFLAKTHDVSILAAAIEQALAMNRDVLEDLRESCRAYAEARLSFEYLADERVALWRSVARG